MPDIKRDLAGLVGKENILDDRASLENYSRDHSFTPPTEPLLVVKPGNVDEVQEVVKWANLTGTPLVPVSSGPPRFYGDTVPSVAGAVIVDLGRMKRIINIDRRNRVTMIEPGVTYSELQPELAKHGLRLTMPLLPRHNKSVVASRLERQPTIVPKYQWTLLEPLRCLEVIWGDGSKLWTGEAGESPPAMKDKWKLGLAQLDPIGPGQIDYYRLVSAAQGTMGIVTWATLRCEVLPHGHKLYFIPSHRLDHLIECLYKLSRVRLGDELLLLNGSHLASILGSERDQILTLRDKLPPWLIAIGIAGRTYLPMERIEFQEKDTAAIVQQCGLKLMSQIPGATAEEVLEAFLKPSKTPFWKMLNKGGFQDIFFLTTLNRVQEFTKTMYSVAEAMGYSLAEIGTYVQPLQQGVSCHCEFSLPYNPDDQGEVTTLRELFFKASQTLLKEGAFFSRPYGIWADGEYGRAVQTTNILRKVKAIFDPKNVLNPGKLCFEKDQN